MKAEPSAEMKAAQEHFQTDAFPPKHVGRYLVSARPKARAVEPVAIVNPSDLILAAELAELIGPISTRSDREKIIERWLQSRRRVRLESERRRWKRWLATL